MNDGFVADSSVGISWSILSQADAATDQLRLEVAGGRRVVVPALWLLEVANTLLMLVRRQRIHAQQRLQACEGLESLNLLIDEEGWPLAFTQISTLAQDHTLTAYDATYLELALRRGLPLASRDSALNQAARRCGIATLL